MNKKRRDQRRDKGFSLIELIVVITIIGILAATVVVNLAGRTDQAKVAAVNVDFKSIETAASLFREDHGRWPDSLEELVNPPETNSGMSLEYLTKLPRDPWTNEPYIFEMDDQGISLYSYGADQSEGGDSFNKDITNNDEDF